jgi:bacteriorhodopsin
MSSLFIRGNQAVVINNSTGTDFHLTSHGSDWLWAVFSIFALSALLSIGFSYAKPRAERLFYNITSVIFIIMSITYFTTASNLGWTSIQAEFNHVTTSDQTISPGLRQIFYVRFIGWFLAFPLVILNYATLFSLDWSNTLFTIAAQETIVLGLLIGSLIRSTYKWGYFTFAVVAFLLQAVQFLWFFRRSAIDVSFAAAGSLFTSLSTLLLMLYLIAWALSYGGNVIQPDSEAVFFGVLDICYFVILGAVFLFFVRGIDYSAYGIATLGRPVLHRSSYIRAGAPASTNVPATKEAMINPNLGEPAVAEPAVAQPAVAQPAVAQPAVASQV